MTAFIVLTDTHLDPDGVEPVGYHQQPRATLRLPALLAHLDAYIEAPSIADTGPSAIDFVLHLGDIVDRATPVALRAVRDAYTLRVPTYLCLGNHDMLVVEGGVPASELWLELAPDFFPDRQLTSTLEFDDCVLHIVPTQWCATPFYWREEQTPHFLPEQIADLEAALVRRPDLPHVLCTHGEVLGVPAAQTGFSAPHHPPPAAWTEFILDLVHRYPQLRLILSGHNHINTHQVVEQAHIVTASAFVETPFEFKVVEITRERMAMTTVPLMPQIDIQADYRWDRTFVQGRRRDRGFEIPF
jgi:DNA repair exonuclease SbcCD nuclease subunit